MSDRRPAWPTDDLAEERLQKGAAMADAQSEKTIEPQSASGGTGCGRCAETCNGDEGTSAQKYLPYIVGIALSALFWLCSSLQATAVDGEPTQAEMQQTVAARIEAIRTNIRDLSTSCRSRESVHTNPLMAIQCLAVAAASEGQGKDLILEITALEKLACARAIGQAGFVCDYVIAFKSPQLMALPILSQLPGRGFVAQGRFLNHNGKWVYVP